MGFDLDVFGSGGNETNGSGANKEVSEVQSGLDLLDLSFIPSLLPNSSNTPTTSDQPSSSKTEIDLIPGLSGELAHTSDQKLDRKSDRHQETYSNEQFTGSTSVSESPIEAQYKDSYRDEANLRVQKDPTSRSGLEPSLAYSGKAYDHSVEHEDEQKIRRPASDAGPCIEGSSVNPFTLLTPYCDTRLLMSLASTSRQAREAATEDAIWKPLCTKAGFRDSIEQESSLLHFTDATNVMNLGYLSGKLSAYRTFSRAYGILYDLIYSSPEVSKKLSHLEKAQALGNAYLLASAVSLRNSVVSEFEEEPSRGIPNELLTTIEESKQALLDEVASFIDRAESIPASLLHAVDIWAQRTADTEITPRAIDLYLSRYTVSLEVEDAFTYYNDSDTRTKQVSQRKVEIAFSKVTASLIQIMAQTTDQSSPIPQSWRSRTWSHSLSNFMGAIAAYLQDVLEVAAKEISELEYLVAVPRLYLASRVLSANSVLIEHGSEADFNVSEYIDLIIMKPLIDEFCERQSVYVGTYARERVHSWNRSISQREDETEEFLWSSVPKKSDKTNFISSFKWAFISADAEEDKNVSDKGSPMPNDGTIPDGSSAPATEFEAQTAVLVSKLRGMESLVSIELAIDVLETCRVAFRRLKTLGRANSQHCEPLFCLYLDIIGKGHIQLAFEKAIKVLNSYDPKRYGRLMISVGKTPGRNRGRIVSGPDGFKRESQDSEDDGSDRSGESNAVEPLAVFTELVNIGDLVQQMVHVFFEEELVGGHIVRQSDFGALSVNAKRRFEQMLDDMLAEGLSRGIDVLMDQVEFTLLTEQLGSDFAPLPTQEISLGTTGAAEKVISLVRSHLDLLRESTEKSLFDVFQQEVGVRLYSSLSKHIKRQTVSVDGAVNLISDVNAYYLFILSLRQKNLLPYYETLKQISQLFLIDKKDAKQIGYAISDSGRYNGLVGTEDILEFVKRRQDWPVIKPKVEKVLYGILECVIS